MLAAVVLCIQVLYGVAPASKVETGMQHILYNNRVHVSCCIDQHHTRPYIHVDA